MSIPIRLKREFKHGIDEFISEMGGYIELEMEPNQVRCPNCVWDSINKKSSNIYDTAFIRPVTVFADTGYSKIIFPVPFNADAPAGVTYSPGVTRPLNAAVCPVCYGEGILTHPNNIRIRAVVNWNPQTGDGVIEQQAQGMVGSGAVRIKTFVHNYGLLTNAKSVIVDGIKCIITKVAKTKGLGGKHLVEAYGNSVDSANTVTTAYEQDPKLKVQELGQTSNQAPSGSPNTPPSDPGDEIW